jgi:phosphatidylserine decarboxylase
MYIHKEGYPTILITLFVFIIVNSTVYFFSGFSDQPIPVSLIISFVLSLDVLIFILSFFRNPKRNTILNDDHVIAPADGKVVVIEEVEEPEYFKDKRIQLSIFMSPLNVHVNRYPISGTVDYVKYHPGQYLVAWHPKSSTENERTTIVVKNQKKNTAILFRQIAGALARRIVNYSKLFESAQQGSEFGFIKFGSRVDVFLPLNAQINVKINDAVKGGESVIAKI